MSSKLRVKYCDHDAVKFACERWHYSGSVPVGKKVKFGVWEDGSFRGVIVYSRGAAINIGSPFGLRQDQICELTRVAMREHECPVSQSLAYSLRQLSKDFEGLRLVVSFADTEQGHHGGIYQATNWVYVGRSSNDRVYEIHGKRYHPKTLHSKFGTGGQSIKWLRENVDPNAKSYETPGKHKYVYPFDDDMRERVKDMRKPYPDKV